MVNGMMLGRRFWRGCGVTAIALALMTACTSTPNGNNPPPVVTDPPVENGNNPPPDTTTDNPTDDPNGEVPATEESQPMVYWLQDEGDRFALAPMPVTPTAETTTGQLEALLSQLLTENPGEDFSSAIPAETQLLSLIIQEDGIVVNLSEDFQFGGGSASMIGRVAQVLYTATSLDPTAAVWFQVEGEPLEVLGGEGLEIAQPLTREIFEADFDL
ncbi:spore germination protein [Synechococcus moorigangaii CMS01]|nr:spore germination protein [Synechococcus moorigangaii CMS01]